MTKQETSIQRDIQKYVNKNKGVISKTHGSSFSKKGEGDLWGAMPIGNNRYIHFAVETKVPGKTEDDAQLYRLEQWALMGYATAVVSSLTEFIQFLKWAFSNNVGIVSGKPVEVWKYYEQR